MWWVLLGVHNVVQGNVLVGVIDIYHPLTFFFVWGGCILTIPYPIFFSIDNPGVQVNRCARCVV